MKGDIVLSRKRPRVAYAKFRKEQDYGIPCDGGHETTLPVMDLIVGSTLMSFCRPCWLQFIAAVTKIEVNGEREGQTPADRATTVLPVRTSTPMLAVEPEVVRRGRDPDPAVAVRTL